MSVYDVQDKNQRTTPRNAVRGFRKGAALVYGRAVAEPPALLGAIADRIRGGRLKNVHDVYSLAPQVLAARTALDVEITDSVPADLWFASGGESRPPGVTDFPRAASFRRPVDAGHRAGERA